MEDRFIKALFFCNHSVQFKHKDHKGHKVESQGKAAGTPSEWHFCTGFSVSSRDNHFVSFVVFVVYIVPEENLQFQRATQVSDISMNLAPLH